MFTTGQEAILKDYGLEGLILYYAGIPFNTLGAFVPALHAAAGGGAGDESVHERGCKGARGKHDIQQPGRPGHHSV